MPPQCRSYAEAKKMKLPILHTYGRVSRSVLLAQVIFFFNQSDEIKSFNRYRFKNVSVS